MKRESEILEKQPTIPSNAFVHGSRGAPASTRRRAPRIASIAKDDCPALAPAPPTFPLNISKSLGGVLSRQPSQHFFSLFYIGQRESARFNQVRHHRLRAPAKQRQQIVNQFS